MCGIAGTVGAGWPAADFDALFGAVRHRGPDGSGVHRAGAVTLGMHRLRLRGDDEQLPVRAADHVVAFNGQVYAAGGAEPANAAEEATALVSARPAVDGMYSCAITDAAGSGVVLATDPFFIKPLFYRVAPNGVAFCSELAPLLRLAPVSLDAEALTDLFTYGWYTGDRTFAADVRLVNRGPVTVRGDEVAVATAGLTDPPPLLPPAPTDAATLRAAIAGAVRRCAGGRGPFALAVSGGVDSTVLAWELDALGVEDLVTISVRSAEDPGLDSLELLGLPPRGAWRTWRHRVVDLTEPKEFLTEFEAATVEFAQPTTMSSLPLSRRLAEVAAEEGVRVVLSGEGADEVFGGYDSYRKVVEPADVPAYYVFPRRDQLVRRLCGSAAVDRSRERFAARYGTVRDLRPVECELRLSRLLLRSDVTLMARSIEGRTPFLHHDVPRLAQAVPWTDSVAGSGKWALRSAYRDVIGARADRPKTRFKIADELLRRCIADESLAARMRDGVGAVFGSSGIDAVDDLRSDAGGFDADICCLLLSTTVLVENGVLS